MAVDYKLEGHVAVITGSTSGIGQALAAALAEQGVNVVLNGLGDPAKIEADRQALQARTNAAVRYHPADMTRPEEIKDLIAYAVREFGRLDILVNNAGIQHVAAVDEFPEEKWDALIAVILTSTFHASRAAIPIMKAQGRGRIINIASAHGLVASPFKAPYVAAKFGVVGFTKGLAVELARTGITANAICPGYVKTPLIEAQIVDQAKTRGIPEDRVMEDVILAAQPTKKFVEYEHLAGMLLYLASDVGASATGAALSVDGGWTAT
ncbi:3-hydroxybutyrate dehydrogenase [Phenylobacterium sp.]|jgi:3-hydroxybutyrate dehydrogenase|uniref:3-hydroxybutyrate dehydrogenase n=1 Tax=Phenylobacterium sp. TaxID=1871053 RepID=UPI0025D1A847|nr:3-hydroxybutyrate dehydrogenase [Phenylobacterium sp.]MCA6284967.1 3-hydroxybutyrate dehydrogenase [Phenylobacterium sp.]MCA6287880.1 3-hydroxybutyrate dehydrogenase [Phenylobacterium sp.]MCA6311139.1 3-hydroxybutyrate dehydrogenase [Phenylobacterium sp.]MCA6324034.1 3-hydroxybutyrate dehydrogenase [Phenylobacterium sp.]MCA6336490.1 3-hydroxybutyrate dehydrogenase [Phenylobacterium sp.]